MQGKVRMDNFKTSPLDMVKEFATVMGQPINLPQSEWLDDEGTVEPFRFSLIEDEFDEFFHERHEAKDAAAALKELADLVYVCYGYASTFGWNLDEALARVHQNNLGRCIQPDGSIQRRADGKILKNPDYPKVELHDLL
jgi:hypothetical protein